MKLKMNGDIMKDPIFCSMRTIHISSSWSWHGQGFELLGQSNLFIYKSCKDWTQILKIARANAGV